MFLFSIASFLFVLCYTSVAKSSDGKIEASIYMRIALNFTLSLGGLGIFNAMGTATYKKVFSFAEAAGASMFTVGGVACLFTITFYLQFFLTLVLPFIAVAISVTFLLFYTVWKSNDSAAVVLRDILRERKYMPTVVVVGFFVYGTVTSTMFAALSCHSEPIGGVYYLKADPSVVCYTSDHFLVCAVGEFVFVRAIGHSLSCLCKVGGLDSIAVEHGIRPFISVKC